MEEPTTIVLTTETPPDAAMWGFKFCAALVKGWQVIYIHPETKEIWEEIDEC